MGLTSSPCPGGEAKASAQSVTSRPPPSRRSCPSLGPSSSPAPETSRNNSSTGGPTCSDSLPRSAHRSCTSADQTAPASPDSASTWTGWTAANGATPTPRHRTPTAQHPRQPPHTQPAPDQAAREEKGG